MGVVLILPFLLLTEQVSLPLLPPAIGLFGANAVHALELLRGAVLAKGATDAAVIIARGEADPGSSGPELTTAVRATHAVADADAVDADLVDLAGVAQIAERAAGRVGGLTCSDIPWPVGAAPVRATFGITVTLAVCIADLPPRTVVTASATAAVRPADSPCAIWHALAEAIDAGQPFTAGFTGDATNPAKIVTRGEAGSGVPRPKFAAAIRTTGGVADADTVHADLIELASAAGAAAAVRATGVAEGIAIGCTRYTLLVQTTLACATARALRAARTARLGRVPKLASLGIIAAPVRATLRGADAPAGCAAHGTVRTTVAADSGVSLTVGAAAVGAALGGAEASPSVLAADRAVRTAATARPAAAIRAADQAGTTSCAACALSSVANAALKVRAVFVLGASPRAGSLDAVAGDASLLDRANKARQSVAAAGPRGGPWLADVVNVAAAVRTAVAVANALAETIAFRANGAAAAGAIAAAAIGAALRTSAVRGAAFPGRIALIGRRLTAGFYGTAATSCWLAGSVATEAHRVGADEVEAVLRAAVAVLGARFAIGGAFPRAQTRLLAVVALVVTMPLLAAVALRVLVPVVCLVRGARPLLPVHARAVVALLLSLALAPFRERCRELAEKAEAEQGTESEATGSARR
jgi:hypothetical protein